MSTTPIRILIAEDVRSDAELEIRALKRAGLEVTLRVADSEESFRAGLREFSPDVILSDFSMPGFDGMAALALAREMRPGTPFIFVSGTIGEERAVEALKSGADDYVMKTSLMRLPAAVERVLADAEARQERYRVETGLRRAQAMAKLAHVITGAGGAFESWSETLPELAGLNPALMPQTTREWSKLLRPEDRLRFREAAVAAGRSRERTEVGYRLQRRDGRIIHVRQTMEPLGEPDAAGRSRWFNTLQDISDQKHAEEELRDSEARFRETFELAGSGMVHVGLDNRFLRANRKLCEMLGYAEHELIGRSFKEITHPDDRDTTDEQRELVRSGELRSASFEKRCLRKDGSAIWASLTIAFARDEAGAAEYSIGVLDDITERKTAEARLARLARVLAVLSGINGAILRIRERQELFDEACRIAVQAGRFPMVWLGTVDREAQRITPVAWNEAAKYLLSAARDRLQIGEGATTLAALALRQRAPFVSNDMEHDPLIAFKKEHQEHGTRSVAMLPLLVGGEAVGVLGLYTEEVGFFDAGEVRLLQELAGNIGFALEHIEKSEKLDYLASYDPLTGLANRTLFHQRLGQYMQSEGQGGGKVALVIADIERFRTINDSLGRRAGDQLLEELARRIVSTCADAKEVARVGSNQFAMVLPGIRDETEAARIVEERCRLLGGAFRLGDTDLRVSMKAGIAIFPADGTDADTLLRNAEAALKKGKASGERYLFYAPQMTERVADKLALENKLRHALEANEFVLHYQPKVDLQTRRIVGLEALIRWQSPADGLVPPMKFIPLLEETGLILDVGAWALTRAALDHRAWVEAGLQPPKVAVNVSAIQLRQRDFVRTVERAIANGIAPTGIDLEITESLIMEDIQGSIDKLGVIRGLGVGISIDDFGTGYSSLAYLARLPVEILKIDRSFVARMLEDVNTMTLVRTIISLAHSLKLKVVAEGVETEDEAGTLRLLGCDQMQGYLFSRPLPCEAMTALLGTARRAGESRPGQ